MIDSPNQQKQDYTNLPKLIQFICEQLPKQAHLILGSEMDADQACDQKFELSDQYRLLTAASFDEVNAALGPLATLMYLKSP